MWGLKGCGTPLAQRLRVDMGPEDNFPGGVRGDQEALECVEQLKRVSLLCWAIWKMVWKV